MGVTVKTIDIQDSHLSEQQWAEQTPGVYMNMLGLLSWNEVDNKYHFAPIKYSDSNLEGETIRFNNGLEAPVVFSCLAMDYANKSEVRDLWWKKAKEVIASYNNMTKIEQYVSSNNVDLNKLRNEGSLLDEEESGMKTTTVKSE